MNRGVVVRFFGPLDAADPVGAWGGAEVAIDVAETVGAWVEATVAADVADDVAAAVDTVVGAASGVATVPHPATRARPVNTTIAGMIFSQRFINMHLSWWSTE